MEHVTEVMADMYIESAFEQIRERDGYAIGTVVQFKDDEKVKTVRNPVIELFNGARGFEQFGGVRFVGDHDGTYEGAYA